MASNEIVQSSAVEAGRTQRKLEISKRLKFGVHLAASLCLFGSWTGDTSLLLNVCILVGLL